MHSVVYEFKVKPGMAKPFENARQEFTLALLRARKSCGSRLHKTADLLLCIACAQWPYQASFELKTTDDIYSETELLSRKKLSESLESSKFYMGLRSSTINLSPLDKS